MAIVGGAEGVQIVTRERRAPVLSGGFGRGTERDSIAVTGKTRVAIADGAEGVQIMIRERHAPMLSGGFGR